MRRLCTALALVVTTAPAAADSPPLDARKGDRPFWSWVIEPHAVEIATVLEKVDELRSLARNSNRETDYLDTRRRALDDALGMLRYARRLAPRDPIVARTLAEVAAERGLLAEAAATYEHYLETGGGDDNTARGALGVIYAQQGRYGVAIEPLRAGVAVRSLEAIQVLAQVYMERGRVTEAIDLLVHSPHADSADSLLTLAVAYDRDEQVGEAAETLGRLSSLLQGRQYLPLIIPTFVPAIDQRYFTALLFESRGKLDQARAEWMAYAAARPAPRFRARALAHVADIDRLGGRR